MHKTSFIIKTNQYRNIGILNLFTNLVLCSENILSSCKKAKYRLD